MHDLDQTRLEFDPELEPFTGELSDEQGDLLESPEPYELAPPDGGEIGDALEAPFEEAEQTGDVVTEEADASFGELDSAEVNFYAGETLGEDVTAELATDLLAVTSEDELDQFLGKLVSRVGKVFRTPAGRALTGILRKVAKKALPIVGGAVGTYFGGPLGTTVGAKLASKAGQMFALETEGLSAQDEQWEIARSFVRFAGAAGRNLATTPPAQLANPAAARAAAASAARVFAPGLLRRPGYAGASASGRWVRRGRKIVLYGV